MAIGLFDKSQREKKARARELIAILGEENLLTSLVDTACYGIDASGLEATPDFVALPKTVNEISAILKLCNRWEMPVTPRGAGSGTTGASVPVKGGLCISFARMNRILSIDPVELTAVCEPGVITAKIDEEAKRFNLFYPPDPASLNFCTIGGNVNTGAGGARAIKYGVTKDYVKGLEVCLPDGTIIKTGTETSKGVVGYDLTRLFVGSEGTLGIVTKVILRLIPRPEGIVTICGLFPRMEDAINAVTGLFLSGILPRCAEFLDEKTLKLVSGELPIEVLDQDRVFLLVELDGDRESLFLSGKRTEEVLKKNGGRVLLARDERERRLLWKVRRSVSPYLKRLGFSKKISEDVCLPRKEISSFLNFLKELERDSGINFFIFGHIGDGNLHVNLLFNKEDLKKELNEVIRELMQRAVSLGGTISGEHGIGLLKMPFIDIELGKRVMDIEKGIKKVFDPKNILNPGKVFV